MNSQSSGRGRTSVGRDGEVDIESETRRGGGAGSNTSPDGTTLFQRSQASTDYRQWRTDLTPERPEAEKKLFDDFERSARQLSPVIKAMPADQTLYSELDFSEAIQGNAAIDEFELDLEEGLPANFAATNIETPSSIKTAEQDSLVGRLEKSRWNSFLEHIDSPVDSIPQSKADRPDTATRLHNTEPLPQSKIPQPTNFSNIHSRHSLPADRTRLSSGSSFAQNLRVSQDITALQSTIADERRRLEKERQKLLQTTTSPGLYSLSITEPSRRDHASGMPFNATDAGNDTENQSYQEIQRELGAVRTLLSERDKASAAESQKFADTMAICRTKISLLERSNAQLQQELSTIRKALAETSSFHDMKLINEIRDNYATSRHDPGPKKGPSPTSDVHPNLADTSIPESEFRDVDDDFVVSFRRAFGISEPLSRGDGKPERKQGHPAGDSDLKVVKTTRLADGSIEESYPSGRRVTYYTNGDIKEEIKDMYWCYYHSKSGARQTILNDGTVVNEFPNGQIDKKFVDGSEQSRYPDGTVRFLYKNGQEDIFYPNSEGKARSTA